MGLGALSRLAAAVGLALADALERTQVDQNVDQRIQVGDRLPVAQSGPFDAEFYGLAVDPFGGGALLVDVFVGLAVPVKLIAQTCADAGRDGRGTATFGPLFVRYGAACGGCFGPA